MKKAYQLEQASDGVDICDADERLDRQRAAGAAGIKLHPNGQFIAPDSPRTVHLCGRCGDRGLPVLFHCGPVVVP